MPMWRSQRLTRPATIQMASATLAGLGLLALLLTSMMAATGGRSGPPIVHARQGHRMVIAGVVPPALGHAKRMGREAAATVLQLSIGLRLTNVPGLQTTLANLDNPASPHYHQYLTPQSFAAKFSPRQADADAIVRFLRAGGLRVGHMASNRLLIDATGRVAQVERIFGTTIGRYQLGVLQFYAPDREPTVPDSLAPLILTVGGLDNLFHLEPHVVVSGHALRPGAQAAAPTALRSHVASGSPLPGAYGPAELRAAYDAGLLITNSNNGAGGVGVFELAPYLPGDIATYRSQYGLPGSTITPHGVDGASPTGDASGTGEADLDLEVISALAPAATQTVYVGPNTTQGINDTYQQMVNDTSYRAIVTGWGLCEPLSGQAELNQLDTFFAQTRVQGQTIFAAAADHGSDDCFTGGDLATPIPPTVDSPADDPNVVGVGGTSLTLNAGTYGSESVWNSSPALLNGGGGGLSSFFSQPSYQIGAGVNAQDAAAVRGVPDVAADADPNTGYSMYCTSVYDCGVGWLEPGGTSPAAALWAAIFNDMDTYQNVTRGLHIGWGNPFLYKAFANAQTYSPYHDVTSGNNNLDYTQPPFQGDFTATACYDLATGMGSPDAWNLARDLAGGVQTGGGGPCPAPVVSTTNLIADGGFETAPGPWQMFSRGGFPLLVNQQPHNGTRSFYACGYPSCDDRVWQTVTLRATIHSATLSFWLGGVTTLSYASTAPPCVDRFSVTLATADGTVFATVQAACNLVAAFPGFSYTLESFPVTSALQAHAGQPIVVTFRATTANEAPSGGEYSYWYVDDISLVVS